MKRREDSIKRDVALVLSSGSSRGLAHIGAIDALIQRGYRISSIAGCSIGALIGGLYAAGQFEQIRQFFRDMDTFRMFKLTDFSFSFSHFFKGERITNTIKTMIPDMRIEQLPIPFTLIATDIISGREQVFHSGELYQMIRASISIPIIFQPVPFEGMLLMDGGITNPLPLNRVQRKENDILVAVNVSDINPIHFDDTDDDSSEREIGYLDTLNRVTDIMVWQNMELMQQMIAPDMAIRVSNSHFGSYEYNHADDIIAFGFDLMNKEIDRYEKSLESQPARPFFSWWPFGRK